MAEIDAPPEPSFVSATLARLPQWLRFIVVGSFNTAVSFGTYLLLLAFGLQYALANFLSLLLGIVVSFRTQGLWVFASTDWGRMRRFVPMWLLIYAFNVAAIDGIMRLGLTPSGAGLVALPFVVMISYLLQRVWVYQHISKSAADVAGTSRK